MNLFNIQNTLSDTYPDWTITVLHDDHGLFASYRIIPLIHKDPFQIAPIVVRATHNGTGKTWASGSIERPKDDAGVGELVRVVGVALAAVAK